MTKRLIKTYEQLCETAGMRITEDGYAMIKHGGEETPVMIKGQRMIMPTPEHLAHPDWKDRIAFHPLYENIARGESKIHAAYRTTLNLNMNYHIGVLYGRLLQIAGDEADQPNLKPDQTEYLSIVKGVDNDLITKFSALLAAYPADRAMVSIFIKPSAMVGTEKFSRVAVVNFPMYEALVKANEAKADKVDGVTINKKRRDVLIKLFEYIFPNIQVKHSYNVGSLSQLSATMDAMMRAALKIIAPVNDLIRLFEDKLAKQDLKPIPVEWSETFEDLASISADARGIPPLLGNEGASKAPATAAAPVKVHAAAILEQPANEQPAAEEVAKAAAFPAPTALKRNPITGELVEEVPPPQPVQTTRPPAYRPPQPSYERQAYRPPQPDYQRRSYAEPANTGYAQPDGVPLNANGKVDFNQLARQNPGALQNTGGYDRNGPQGRNERVPGWAGNDNRGGGSSRGGYGRGGRGGSSF